MIRKITKQNVNDLSLTLTQQLLSERQKSLLIKGLSQYLMLANI